MDYKVNVKGLLCLDVTLSSATSTDEILSVRSCSTA